jgi:hypothetical protein
VHLDGLVEDPLHGLRGRDLDRLDLGVGGLVAGDVHQPRGLEHQQTQLLDLDPRLGDPVAHDALLGDRLAEGDPLGRALAHHLDGSLGDAQRAHAVVDAARPETRLGDREALALAADDVADRHADVGEPQLGVAAVVAVVVAEHVHAADDLEAGGVALDQDLALLAVTRCRGIGLAHHDEDLAVGVHGAGDPPLATVDDVLVTVPDDAELDIGGVRRRDLRLGHRERRADLAGEQGLQPLLLLLVGAEHAQHLHVAGVGRGAVEGRRPDLDAAPGELGDGRVLEVGQARTVLGGVEEVPESLGLRLGTDLHDDRRERPRVVGDGLLDLLLEHLLGGVDLGLHEGRDLLDQRGRLLVVSEVHLRLLP